MMESLLKEFVESRKYVPVSAYEVYKDIFHIGEGLLQKALEPSGKFKSNPIAYWRNNGAEQGHYRVMFEDKFEEILPELQAADFCILNGVTYFGRKNVQAHASKMYCMIFDLDDVSPSSLTAFMSGAVSAGVYPMPNYLILSGHGVHLYYVFEKPVDLFPYTKTQLKNLKYALTELMWNRYTSNSKTKQLQGINQGFRIIGGKTKPGAPIERVLAYRVWDYKYKLQDLCRFLPKDSIGKIDETKLFKERRMSIAEAKEKYPRWYERVVLGKESARKKWDIAGKVHGDNPWALYDWWLDKIKHGAMYSHRYFCIMCLVIYGVKCDVPYKKVKQDSYDLIPFLTAINPQYPFTEEDVESALECYDDKYCTFPIKDIEKLSAIIIKRNRRNGRTQASHLARARAVQAVDDPDGKWRNMNGRPVGSGTKQQAVYDYASAHPDATIASMARDLGISRTTVYKYMNEFRKGVIDGVENEVQNESFSSDPYVAAMSRLKTDSDWMKNVEENSVDES